MTSTAIADPPISPKVPYKPCGAKKRNGEPCKGAAMRNGRCRLHGGLSPTGMANGNFKHGRYSKYVDKLPKAFGDGYQSALNDEELVSLREELSLLSGMQSALLQKMVDAEVPPFSLVVAALKKLHEAEGDEVSAALEELYEVAERGAAAELVYKRAINELREVIQEKKNVSQAEHKRMVDKEGLVEVDKVLMYVQAFLSRLQPLVPADAFRRAQEEAIRMLPPPREQVIDG